MFPRQSYHLVETTIKNTSALGCTQSPEANERAQKGEGGKPHIAGEALKQGELQTPSLLVLTRPQSDVENVSVFF